MQDSAAAPNIRAAIYARVSSEEQREGQTIDSQVAELERFAREKNWQIAGVYKDDGWSGSLLARPELDRLRDDASRGLFDLVLLNDVDRLARDVAHLGIVKRDLESRGVEVVFRKLPAEKSPTYNLMVNILGSFAEFEREMIADRTRRGRRHKVEVRQQFLGSLAAYGYRYVPKDKSGSNVGFLAIIPEEAAVIQQMYRWVSEEGLSAHKVVERLNEKAIPPRKGNLWGKSSVIRILRNEMYAGVWYYNKHYGCQPIKPKKKDRYRQALKSSNRLRPRLEWLPVILPEQLRIIERSQWKRVQAQLTSNIAFSSRNTKHFYLLSGLLTCGGCSAAFVGTPNHGRFYYRCSKSCRKVPSIRERPLDEVVWSAVEEAVFNPTMITEQVSKYLEREEVSTRQFLNESEQIERDIQKLVTEESRVLEAYRIGILSPSQLGRELEKIGVRKNILKIKMAGNTERPDQSIFQTIRKSVTDYCQRAAERFKSFNLEERQRFLRLIIDRVFYEGDRVRIKAILPLSEAGVESASNTFTDASEKGVAAKSSFASMLSHYHNQNPAYIENTTTHYDGRNPVIWHNSKDLMLESRNRIDHVSFELCRGLPKLPFSILSKEGLELVRLLKEELGDPTLQELCDRVQDEKGMEVSVTHMSRTLRKLNLSPTRRGPRRSSSHKKEHEQKTLKRAA
jgi:site-specific DNA recombinase